MSKTVIFKSLGRKIVINNIFIATTTCSMGLTINLLTYHLRIFSDINLFLPNERQRTLNLLAVNRLT